MKLTFFAGLFSNDALPGFAPMGSVMKERLIVIGALLLVVVVALLWVVLSRQKRRRAARRKERHHRRQSFSKNAARSMAELKQLVKNQQSRGRRRHHRPRNPTLAETGGLPPVRDDPPSQTQPR